MAWVKVYAKKDDALITRVWRTLPDIINSNTVQELTHVALIEATIGGFRWKKEERIPYFSTASTAVDTTMAVEVNGLGRHNEPESRGRIASEIINIAPHDQPFRIVVCFPAVDEVWLRTSPYVIKKIP